MSVFLLMTILSALTAADLLLSKKFSLHITLNTISTLMMNVMVSICAVCFFSVWILVSQTPFTFNLPTVLFAVAFALIVASSLITSILAYQYISMPMIAITSNAGGIILAFFFGIFFLKEATTWKHIMAAILLLIAIVLPYRRNFGKTSSMTALFLCVLLFLNSGAVAIINKLYAIHPLVCDSKLYFWLTNLIIGAGSCSLLPLVSKKQRCPLSFSKYYSGGMVAMLCLKTIFSNLCSVVNILVLVQMSIGSFTVASSSLTLILNTLISRLCFKEKQTAAIYFSLVLSIIAIMLYV